MKLINNHSEFNAESRSSFDVTRVYRCLPGGAHPTLLCCNKAPSDQIHGLGANVTLSCSDSAGTGSDAADLLPFGSRNREIQANWTQTTRTQMLNADLKVI